jgi:hypothetical protein
MRVEQHKKILDVCCGGRMFWFNKKHPNALYLDNRTMPAKRLTNGATLTIAPDQIMDFRNLRFYDESFSLVVFDPPHVKWRSVDGWMADKYGQLDKKTWQEDLRAGFAECFRVLKKDGVLIFKWSEIDIPLKEVLALTPMQPLFGHPSGKASKTHWVAFMK